MKTYKEIYTLIIESIILEAMSLEEIWEKYYKNDVNEFETFRDIILIDPTADEDKKGKYGDWLIKKAWTANKLRVFEDDYKIREDLELFDKNFRHINKQITQIKDHYELAKIVSEFRKKQEAGEIDLSRSEMKKQIEKIFEDSDWLLLTPKTKESAKYYGKNTRWCTAAEKNNYFEDYNKDGPLYILINKKAPSEKYQFHFQSEQYMDSEDQEISDASKFIPEYILNKILDLAKQNKAIIPFILSVFTRQEESKYLNKYNTEYQHYLLNKEFLQEVDECNLQKIKHLVEKGADIDAQNGWALEHASKMGYLDIVKYLVENGANIHLDDDIALRRASFKGHFEIVKYLVENGANVNANYGEALLEALHNNYFKVVKYLVENGADIHLEEEQALKDSAYMGQLQMVKHLVENGADIHVNNDEPLRYAVANGHFEVVKYLVEKGADIHAKNNEPIIMAKTKEIKDYLQSIIDKEKK